MQTLSYKTSVTPLQKLFIEKALELCNYGSLDSYRAKVACPTYALNEFYTVANDMYKEKIKYFETFASFRDELIDILNCDELLGYGRMTKKYFIDLIGSIKDKDQFRVKFDLIEHNTYYLLTKNRDYKLTLINQIKNIIDIGYIQCDKHKDNEQIPCTGCKIICMNSIEYLTSTLISEILNHGYSKEFIHKYIMGIFTSIPFDEAWVDFKGKIENDHNVEMKVVFKLIAPADKLKKITEDKLKSEINELDLSSIDYIKTHSFLDKNNKIINWLKPSGLHKFVVFTVDALDYGQALKKAKTELSNLLDLLYLGFSETKFDIDSFAIVCDESKPKKANLQSIYYKIDGVFKSTSDNYNYIRNNVVLIKSRRHISNEVKVKIETAIRYLRSGSEALELEQKFLNYWIGLENIFSDNNPNNRTFERLVRHFTVAHIIAYTKRNITEYHKDIHRTGLNRILSNYGNQGSMRYLTSVDIYNEIISMNDDYPLLANRARFIKSNYLSNEEKIDKLLKNHKKNLERHLTRMYMIRNQLVHDAAIMQNIENITGNLRYYLTFILNKLIDFFSDCKDKPLKDNKVTMNDFFNHNVLIWENLNANKLTLEELLYVPHSADFTQ